MVKLTHVDVSRMSAATQCSGMSEMDDEAHDVFLEFQHCR